MLRQVRVLEWLLEVDREATSAAYDKMQPIWPFDCKCRNCQNWVTAVDLLPPEFKELCEILGIDPTKTPYLTMNAASEGSCLYDGSYDLIGRILHKPDLEPGSYVKLSESFEIRFFETGLLGPDDFPEPAFSLLFWATIPWVLDGEPM